MNKTQKAILMAVIAIVVGLILLLCSVFAGGGPVRILQRGLDLLREEPAQTQYIEESTSPDSAVTPGDASGITLQSGDRLQFAEFNAIELKSLACDVALAPATEGEFGLSFQGLTLEPAQAGQYLLIYKGDDRERITVELKEGRLIIDGGSLPQVSDFSGLRSLIWDERRRITLLVPEDWGGKVTVQSTVGDIDLNGAAFGELDISLAAGDLELTDVSCQGKTRLQLLAGDLELKRAALGDLDIDLKLGDLELDDLSCGAFSLTANAGDLDLTDVACGDLDISMNAGDLELINLSCGKLQVKLDAGNIDFTDLELDSAEIYCRMGDVDGSLSGGPEDYRVDCRVRMGDCHVSEPGTGSKPVTVQLDMGSIYLRYRH